MKNNIMNHFGILIVLLIAAGMTSCHIGNEVGPEGPPGRDGNANVQTFHYVLKPSDWIQDPGISNEWYCSLYCPEITQYIVDYGAVLCYMKGNNSDNWGALPYTAVYYDNNVPYSVEWDIWHYYNSIDVFYIDNHPTAPSKPNHYLTLKVVIIEGNPGALKILNGIDKKDYLQVKNALNIIE